MTLTLVLVACTARADILRWDNGQVIPGTEGITAGPGVDLGGWNSDSHNLRYADFSGLDLNLSKFQPSWLDNARFTGANLTSADLAASILTSANLTDANLSNAYLVDSTLTSANLTGANLTGANLWGATLTNANLSGAVVKGAVFFNQPDFPGAFTQAQLSSTQSYQDKSLMGIQLFGYDLTGWDFTGQDLSNAYLIASDLTNANLSGADLRHASLGRFHPIQELWGSSNLSNAELSGAALSNANLIRASLTNAKLSFSDLRGAVGLSTAGVASLRNSILPEGIVMSLELKAGELLVVRDDDGVPDPPPQWWLAVRQPIPVTVQDHLTMADSGVLELRFDADTWDSLISFEPGIPVTLGGTLELTFDQDADPATQVGHTLDLFDWTGVSPTGAFTVTSLYDWDLSRLYSTGEVTLLVAGCIIAGDSTGDGKVDLDDFGILKDHFGAAATRSEGDANGDEKIDLSDFGLLKLNFGKSAAGVPEPTTLVLALLAASLVVAPLRALALDHPEPGKKQ